uniref:G-protein coupled receptors family 1 profile domain-containing protein n=1 Tax=Setaria digitata TaxID=48799 RepID=A0A915Q3J4_9BILA
MADDSDNGDKYTAARISYLIESAIYALAMLLGMIVCCYTSRRFNPNYRRHVVLAARLVRFKISLTVADLIVLYVYAPTQIIWIITYNWYGGDFLCRTTKFINTFSLHLTANMQVLIAADRLYITAHLRQIHQKSRFATNQMIALAWLLAIACALPQLFVFHVYILPNGKPQCVSVWTVMRFREYLEQEIAQVHHLDSTTVADNITSATYSALHLLSIYILPYSVELLCYALMLILMKQFHSDGNDKKTQKKRHCWFQRTANLLRHSGGKFSVGKNPNAGSLLQQWDSNAGTTVVRIINTNDKSTSKWIRRLLMPPLRPFNPQSNETMAVEEMKQRRSSVAWKNTVALARRKTRRKAFLMLTLNMIFWTPYCVMGILSTIMEFDHSGYDFLNALVVLNAVSNLLL